MTKVYPNNRSESLKPESGGGNVEVLTVWRKSLLPNCSGFTVFDAKGNLAFRVDNYAAGHKGKIVLMDGAGEPLFTFRRKKLTLADNWVVFAGESSVNPLFSVKKPISFLKSKGLVQVTHGNCTSRRDSGVLASQQPTYNIEGSYSQRACAVYDERRRQLAEIKRKEAIGGVGFGVDVFRLVVQPEFDSTVAMSFVILLDKMFGSRRFS